MRPKNPNDVIINNKKLSTIIKSHQAWLNDVDKAKPADFSGMTLENIDFSGVNLKYANFTNTTIYHCSFDRAILDNADFDNANITNCWFEKGTSLIDAGFVGSTISYSSFDHANIEEANFYRSNLEDINFSDSKADRAVFKEATIRYCKFEASSMQVVSFECAKIYVCTFKLAYLFYALFKDCIFADNNFTDAILYNATINHITFEGPCSFYDAVLKNCHISRLNAEFMENANFETADICGNTINADKFMVCPEDGSFTGWKRVVTAKEEPLIVKLEIPANAQRSSANGRKCRASEAKVIAIYDMNTGKAYPKNRYAYSIYRPGFKYKVGETVACEKEFDTNRWNECASGIHFFMTRREAENY